MSDRIPVETRDLMVAISDLLDVPHPESRTEAACVARLELIAARVDHLRGLLASYAGPSDMPTAEVAAAVRAVAQRHPVTYKRFGDAR